MKTPTVYLCAALLLMVACKSTTQSGATHSFAATNRMDVEVPKGAKNVRIWFPVPMADSAQRTFDLKVTAPAGWRQTHDVAGNSFVYLELQDPDVEAVTIQTDFNVTRREVKSNLDPAATRPLTSEERERMARDLAPNTHIQLDAESRKLAKSIVGDEENPILASRKLYDWVLDNVDYWVKDPATKKASGVGSSSYCLSTKTGNCTDFHSLYTSLSRSAGIPTRMKYGSFFKVPLDGKDRDQSYHCWPEFWAPNIGWIPLDVAVADLYVDDVTITEANVEKVSLTLADGYHGPDKDRVDYYFGNLEPRRVAWHVGRDLTLAPPQSAGPVNAIPKGYVEVDGEPYTNWTRKLTFTEIK